MADNATASGGDTIRTIDKGGIEAQVVILDLGGAGAESLATGAIPVTDNSSTLSIDDGGGSITVDVGSAPATDRTTDHIGAAQMTDAVMNGLTALTPKYAKVVASASAATQVVALVSSKKIRVLSWSLVTNGAVNVKWQSHTAGDITGLHYFAANGGISSGFCPVGHFETTAGEALDINLSSATAVGGSLVYVEV